LTEAFLTGQYFVDGRLYIDYIDVNDNPQTLDVDTPSSGSLTVRSGTSFTARNTSNFRGFSVPVDSSTITITVDGTPTSVAGDTISGSSTPITAAAPAFTATNGSTYTVAASTSVVVTPILYPCMYVGYIGTTCCEAISGYDPAAAATIYDGTFCDSFTLSSSSGNYFAIGSTIVDPYTGDPFGGTALHEKWIYDGANCWHIDNTNTIYESGSCVSPTSTPTPTPTSTPIPPTPTPTPTPTSTPIPPTSTPTPTPTLPVQILTSFNSGTGLNNNAWTVDYDSNNNYIVGGEFTAYNGVTYNRIIRFNSSGVPDSTFNGLSAGFNGKVYVVKVQPDNKILVGGIFTSYNGVVANRIIRLNYDGTIDNTFDCGVGIGGFLGGRQETVVFDIDVQTDGKILIIGSFTTYNGITVNGILRVDSGGTYDSSFVTGSGLNICYYGFIRQRDENTIIIGGYMGNYNGINTRSMCRLSSTGTFLNYYVNDATNSGHPEDIFINTDGTLISVGTLSTGSPSYNVVPIKNNNDYTRNTTFLSNVGTGFGPYPTTYATAYAIDGDSTGKYVIGGSILTTYNGNPIQQILKINSDGTYDNTWNTSSGFNGNVYDLKINEIQNLIYVVGSFTSFSGQSRQRVAVLNLNFISPTPTPTSTPVPPTPTFTPTPTPTSTPTPTI
jgi:hypothetical protein